MAVLFAISWVFARGNKVRLLDAALEREETGTHLAIAEFFERSLTWESTRRPCLLFSLLLFYSFPFIPLPRFPRAFSAAPFMRPPAITPPLCGNIFHVRDFRAMQAAGHCLQSYYVDVKEGIFVSSDFSCSCFGKQLAFVAFDFLAFYFAYALVFVSSIFVIA